MKPNNNLIIDLLIYKPSKAYGYQEYIFNLLDYFYKNRNYLSFYKIILICNIDYKLDFIKYADKFELKGFKVKGILSRLYIQITLNWKMKISKSDVILYSYNYSSPIKICKSVLVIHDLLYLRKKYLPNRLMRIQRKFYIPRSIYLSDCVIAISKFTLNDILRNIKNTNSNNLVYIYNYFNLDKFISDSKEIDNIPLENYFLCVSSQSPHKNLITVLKAFKIFCYNNLDYKLFLVGNLTSGEAFDFYSKLDATTKKRIHIFKDISNSDLGILYKNAKGYISASFFEGLGMPIVEAMYFNVPLLISDIEIFKEITEDKAFFFNPNSPEELVQVMNNYDDRFLPTREFILNKFSEENTSESYIKILNEIGVQA